MNDDLIAILEDFIIGFEGIKDISQTCIPEFEDKVYKPFKDIYERVKNILHIHLGQSSQQMSQFQKSQKIEKVQSLLKRQDAFLKQLEGDGSCGATAEA